MQRNSYSAAIPSLILFMFSLLFSASAMAGTHAQNTLVSCAIGTFDPGSVYTSSAPDENGAMVTLTTSSVFDFSQRVAGSYQSNQLTVSGNAAALAEYILFVECVAAEDVVLMSSLWLNDNGFEVKPTAIKKIDSNSVVSVLAVDGTTKVGGRTYVRMVNEASILTQTCDVSYWVVQSIGGNDFAIDFSIIEVDPADHPGHSCSGDPCSACAMYENSPEGAAKYISCGCRRNHGSSSGARMCNHSTAGGKIGGQEGALVFISPGF